MLIITILAEQTANRLEKRYAYLQETKIGENQSSLRSFTKKFRRNRHFRFLQKRFVLSRRDSKADRKVAKAVLNHAKEKAVFTFTLDSSAIEYFLITCGMTLQFDKICTYRSVFFARS